MRNEPGGAGLILSERRGARFAAWWEDGAVLGGICQPSGQATALTSVRKFTEPEPPIRRWQLGQNGAFQLGTTDGRGGGSRGRFGMDFEAAVFDGTSNASPAHRVTTIEPQPGGAGLRLGEFPTTQIQRILPAIGDSPRRYGLGE